MKHHGIKLVGILLRVALLLTIVFTSLTGCFCEEVLSYSDINLYINNNYDTVIDDEQYRYTSNSARMFFPSYEDFEYKDCLKGFHIFDGTKTVYGCYSFVLELQFDDVEEYEQFVIYEHNRCAYTDKFNISHNGYECYITLDEEITSYCYGREYPFRFGMLCENQEILTVRYVFYRKWEGSCGFNNFNEVFKNTNCAW